MLKKLIACFVMTLAAGHVLAQPSTSEEDWKAIQKDPAAAAQRLNTEVDAAELKISNSVKELTATLAELDKDRKDWTKLDKSVDAARKVNAALLVRCESIIARYDTTLGPAMSTMKAKLKAATLASVMLEAKLQQKAKDAETDIERQSYESMVQFTQAATVLAGRRYEALFSPPEGGKVSKADELQIAMTQVRRMRQVHADWATTLDAWPTTLNDPKVVALLADMSKYAEQMVAYQQSMSKLAGAFKEAAAEPAPKSEAKK